MTSQAERIRRRKLRNGIRAGQGVPTMRGPRTADGTLSEARGAVKREPEGPAPTIAARIRDLGIKPDEANSPEAGTGHGLLKIAGIITDDGYRLAGRYVALRQAWGGMYPGPKEAASARLPYIPPERTAPPVKDAVTGTWESDEDRIERIRKHWFAVVFALAAYPHFTNALNDAAVRGHDLRRDRRSENAVKALRIIAPLFGLEPGDVAPPSKRPLDVAAASR